MSCFHFDYVSASWLVFNCSNVSLPMFDLLAVSLRSCFVSEFMSFQNKKNKIICFFYLETIIKANATMINPIFLYPSVIINLYELHVCKMSYGVFKKATSRKKKQNIQDPMSQMERKPANY